MQEILLEAVRLVNLPFTVLLAIVIAYWILVALGALGSDLEGDGPLQIEGDVEAPDLGWLSQALHFLNLRDVPVTIVLSVFLLWLWTGSLIANHYWTGGSVLLAIAALIPNVIVSALLTRMITTPFKPLLRALNREGEEHLPLVGRTCEITTSEVTTDFGQARVDRRGAPVIINVRAGSEAVLTRGSTGLIVREDKAKGVFHVVEVSSDKLG